MLSCWGWGGSWGMGFGWIFMIFFWALVLFGIVAMIRWASGPSFWSTGARGKTALEILQERYARGEIQKEEFEERKRGLTA